MFVYPVALSETLASQLKSTAPISVATLNRAMAEKEGEAEGEQRTMSLAN